MATSNTTTAAANLTSVVGGTNYWVQNSGAADSLTQLDSGALRFEVDPGAVWQNDPSSLNRSEIASTQQISNGTPIHVSYGLNVQSGASDPNTAAWAVLGQFHQNDGPNTPHNSPPFAVTLVGGKMGISVGYTDASGKDVSSTIWTDSSNIIQGATYAMDISVTFDPNGNGHLTVARNGVTLVDYTGPLGYASQSSVYWKEGIYKLASTTAMVADYSNLSVSTPTVGTSATATVSSLASTATAVSSLSSAATAVSSLSSAPTAVSSLASAAVSALFLQSTGPSVFSTTKDYDATTGKLTTTTIAYSDSSTATTSYYSTGAPSQLLLKNANGSSETDSYGTDGSMTKKLVINTDGSSIAEWYTNGKLTQHIEATKAGVQTLSQQYDATGALTFTSQLGADGTLTQTKYNSSGSIAQQACVYTSGYRDVTNYGITGQAYTSQKSTYNSFNQLVGIALYRADNSLLSNQTIRSDGSKSTLTYDAAGTLTSSTNVAANGSRDVYDYGIQGQNYTSDHLMYNSAGQMTFLQRFQADGKLLFNQTFGATGSSNYYIYGSSGNVSQRTTTQANGSVSKYDYAADGITVLQQRQYDTAGNVTQITRYNMAGATTFTESLKTDGSNVQLTYDNNGNLTQRLFVNADKSSTSYTYNATSSSNPTSITILDAAGRMTSKTLYNSDGTKEIDTYNVAGTTSLANQRLYNSTGTCISNVNYHPDGSLASSQVTSPDGTYTSNNYSSTGTLLVSSVIHPDKSSDTYQYGMTTGNYVSSAAHYNTQGVMTHLVQTASDGSTHVSDYAVTGQTYTSQVTNFNASGTETSTMRYHADGTLDYYDSLGANGSRTTYTYDPTGKMTSAIATTPDGSITEKALASGISMASGSGNDIFTSFHNDSFAFHANFGKDTIYGFNAGSGALHDLVQIDTSMVADYSHLAMSQSGSDAMITITPHDVITLKNTNISALTASDFKFV